MAAASDRLPGRGGDLVRVGRARRAVRVRADPPAARHRRLVHQHRRDIGGAPHVANARRDTDDQLAAKTDRKVK
jgi:hypothetical protein